MPQTYSSCSFWLDDTRIPVLSGPSSQRDACITAHPLGRLGKQRFLVINTTETQTLGLTPFQDAVQSYDSQPSF